MFCLLSPWGFSTMHHLHGFWIMLYVQRQSRIQIYGVATVQVFRFRLLDTMSSRGSRNPSVWRTRYFQGTVAVTILTIPLLDTLSECYSMPALLGLMNETGRQLVSLCRWAATVIACIQFVRCRHRCLAYSVFLGKVTPRWVEISTSHEESSSLCTLLWWGMRTL